MRRHVIEALFLSAASAAFATLSVWNEILTGEPALRGLVHAGIGGLFVLLLYTKPDHPIAPLFASFAMAIGAFAEWSSQDWMLSTVLAAGALETLRFDFPAAGAYIALGSAQLVTLGSANHAADGMAFVFHASFVSSMGTHPATSAVQAAVSATLALHERESPSGLLFCLAFMRACWSAWRGFPNDEAIPYQIETYVTGSWSYVLSVAFYCGALLTDAWTCCVLDTCETTTRMLHVTVVGASLMYLLPTALHALPWIRWPLMAFPLLDAFLCIYRIASSPVMYPRAIGAFLVAALLHAKQEHVDIVSIDSPRSPRCEMLNRAAMGIYAVAHTVEALRATAVHKALAIMFHYIVIVLSLSWMGLVEMDWLSVHFARAFLVLECATSIVLLALVQDPWSALTVVCSAFLCWRVHSEKSRANAWFDSSLLSIGRSPVAVHPSRGE